MKLQSNTYQMIILKNPLGKEVLDLGRFKKNSNLVVYYLCFKGSPYAAAPTSTPLCIPDLRGEIICHFTQSHEN